MESSVHPVHLDGDVRQRVAIGIYYKAGDRPRRLDGDLVSLFGEEQSLPAIRYPTVEAAFPLGGIIIAVHADKDDILPILQLSQADAVVMPIRETRRARLEAAPGDVVCVQDRLRAITISPLPPGVRGCNPREKNLKFNTQKSCILLHF